MRLTDLPRAKTEVVINLNQVSFEILNVPVNFFYCGGGVFLHAHVMGD